MNCREFRRKHDAYVDDTLSGVDIEGMGQHLRLCPQCAALDTRIRRSLLLARNLPTIEPSAAFGERLQMRLAQERAFMAARQHDTDAMLGMMARRHRSSFTTGTFVALAAGIAVAAGLLGRTDATMLRRRCGQQPVLLAATDDHASPDPDRAVT